MAIIGLDIGGSGAKAVAFDYNGNIISLEYQEYDMIQEKPGWFEVNPDILAEASLNVLKKCAKNCKEKIEGIGVSSFAESFVLLDKNDKVLCNSIMYLDNRGQQYIDDFNQKFNVAEHRMKTGTFPRILHSIFKYQVIKEYHPEIVDKINRIEFICGFVLGKLGGGSFVDYGVASSTCTFHIREKHWIKESLDWAGIDIDKMPKPVPHGYEVGKLTKEAAIILGIDAGIPLTIGGHDHIPSSVGSGVFQSGTAMNAIGTVDTMMIITDNNNVLTDFPERGYSLKNHVMGDNYALMLNGNLTGGVLLKWFREHIGRYEKENWLKEGKDFYGEYDKQIPDNPTDLIALPRFGAYGDNLDSRGAILNMTLSTTNEEIYRALMEGESLEMYLNMQRFVSKGMHVDNIIAVNGGANSRKYMQIRSDIYNLPLRTIDCPQPGCLGNAMLAGVNAGVYKDLKEAANACVKIKDTFYPIKKNNEFYMEKYQKYQKIYDYLKDIKA